MKIELELLDSQAALIQQFVVENQAIEDNSDGPLTMEVLAEMLMVDVALAVRRPGSWEGSNMIQVLNGHGYKI